MKVTTAPGLSVTRKTSASGLVCRSSAKPSLGVIAAMRLEPRSGQNSPEFDQTEMRRDDQPVELLVGRVGEREHRPVAARPLVVGLDLDAAHDAVGAGAVDTWKFSPWLLVDFDGARQVERDVVARDLDRLDGKRRPKRRTAMATAARSSASEPRLEEFSRQNQSLVPGVAPIVGDQCIKIVILPASVDLQVGSQTVLRA